jgi:hypothetical protein
MSNTPFADLPLGLIPRIERVSSQLKVIRGTRSVPWIMIDLDDAERFVGEGMCARDVHPQGNVVTTSTIHDRILSTFHLDREFGVIESFKPRYHIPCDRPVYQEQNLEERLWFIDKLVEGTLVLRDQLKGSRTELLPLVKGLRPEEWRSSYAPLAGEGFVGFCFYGSQYFGRNVGKRDQELVNTVRGILSSCDIQYILLVGYQSVSRVQELPRSVRAFAGLRWRSHCGVGKVPPGVSRRILEELIAESRSLPKVRQEVLRGSTALPALEAD